MPLERFLNPSIPSLKICGVTLADDASKLVALGVEALGVNFWPKSKRYLDPAQAGWLKELSGKILRVGVFVNPDIDAAISLVRAGLIDVIQLHGDETPETAVPIREAGIPFFKAIGVHGAADLDRAIDFGADALLLDAPAPGVYGGTGETFDWSVAAAFIKDHPALPVILAGGIVPGNAADALAAVHPTALDVASGSESSPGIKDFEKIEALLAAVRAGQ
ncbi:MAG: N-(5'-phosphoribosyl)anthranilate isomerase [Verrucomicrobiales bacterium VVV1]|nr:MAG: N-(5'-phosphoribosyl)anthranilate isomerase [Verrucomicrobiales bacterium VVV1]